MFNYEKQIIGLLFNYYRKKNKCTIQKFISYKSNKILERCEYCDKQCKSKPTIISHKTVERVNKGHVSKNECLYIDFSDKLGFEYELTIQLNSKIEEFEKELLTLIRSKNEKSLKLLQARLSNFKKQLNRKIYYYQLTTIFEAVVELELNNKYCNQDFIEMMEHIYNYVRLDTKKIFIYYFYRYFFNIKSMDKLEHYFEEGNKYYSENVQMLFTNLPWYLTPFDVLNKLKDYEVSHFSEEDYFFYYDSIALAYLNLEKFQESTEYLDKCIAIAKENGMIKSYLYQCYMRKGFALYYMENYKESLECFRYAYLYDINIMMMNSIMFFDCFTKLKMEDSIKSYLLDTHFSKIHNKMIAAVFTYYKLKYINKAKESDLEDYILKHLRPYLRKGTIYERIILDDLNEYAKKTSHFKKISEFMTDTKKK